MEEATRLNTAGPATAGADMKSVLRCEDALELLLTHRGDPSAEIERVLTDDPEPRAGRREVRSGGRGPPLERRSGMQSSQHIQSALMLRLSARSHSPAEATLGPNPIPANIAAAARAMIDVRFMANVS